MDTRPAISYLPKTSTEIMRDAKPVIMKPGDNVIEEGPNSMHVEDVVDEEDIK